MYRSNSSIVKKAIRMHIYDFFNDIEGDLVPDYDSAGKVVEQVDYIWIYQPNVYEIGVELVQSGFFLMYDIDIIEFLNSLNLKNKSYYKKPLEFYSHLIGKSIDEIYKTYKELEEDGITLEYINELGGKIPIYNIKNLKKFINQLEILGYEPILSQCTDFIIV